jgi:hypothetical protein
MSDNTGGLIMFLIIIGFVMICQIIYASSQDALQCIFSRDVITCIEIARSNK